MVRSTTNIDWYEIGFWSVDEKKHTWHCLGAYAERDTAEGDMAKAKEMWPDKELSVRGNRRVLIVEVEV